MAISEPGWHRNLRRQRTRSRTILRVFNSGGLLPQERVLGAIQVLQGHHSRSTLPQQALRRLLLEPQGQTFTANMAAQGQAQPWTCSWKAQQSQGRLLCKVWGAVVATLRDPRAAFAVEAGRFKTSGGLESLPPEAAYSAAQVAAEARTWTASGYAGDIGFGAFDGEFSYATAATDYDAVQGRSIGRLECCRQRAQAARSPLAPRQGHRDSARPSPGADPGAFSEEHQAGGQKLARHSCCKNTSQAGLEQAGAREGSLREDLVGLHGAGLDPSRRSDEGARSHHGQIRREPKALGGAVAGGQQGAQSGRWGRQPRGGRDHARGRLCNRVGQQDREQGSSHPSTPGTADCSATRPDASLGDGPRAHAKENQAGSYRRGQVAPSSSLGASREGQPRRRPLRCLCGCGDFRKWRHSIAQEWDVVHEPFAQMLALHLHFEVQHSWWNHPLCDPRIDGDSVQMSFALPTFQGLYGPTKDESEQHLRALLASAAGSSVSSIASANVLMDSLHVVELANELGAEDLSISTQPPDFAVPQSDVTMNGRAVVQRTLGCTKLYRRVGFNFSIEFWFPGPEQLSLSLCHHAAKKPEGGSCSLEGCFPSSAKGGASPPASRPPLCSHAFPCTCSAVSRAGCLSPEGCIPGSVASAGSFKSAPIICDASASAPCLALDGPLPGEVIGCTDANSKAGPASPAQCCADANGCADHGVRQFGVKSRGRNLVIPVGRAPHALAHSGRRATAAPQLSEASAFEAKPAAFADAGQATHVPFTSFDAVNGAKSLMGLTSWRETDFILRAIEASGLPGAPSGRVLRHPVKDFACPQVALLRGGFPPGRRAIIVDSRFIGGDVFVLEVIARTLAIEVVQTLSARQSLGALLDALRAETIGISVNGLSTALNDPLLPDTDVLEFHEGRGTTPAALHEAASAATTEPFEVVLHNRPSTPPVPSGSVVLARRWKREGSTSVAEQAAEANKVRTRFQVRGIRRCTVFDPLRQVETVHTATCDEPFALLSWAISRARHLGARPDGRVINHVLDSFPEPQVCIHPPLRADFIALPVEVSPGIVCTVVASREASALALMTQLERDCSVTRMQRLLLTRGAIRMVINGISVDDIHEPNALIVADTARITPHYVLLEHGVVPEVETLTPHWRNAVGPFVLHRPGQAPVEVQLPEHLSPSEVRRALIAMGFLDNAGSIHTPYVSPAVPGIGAHLLLLNRQQVESETTFAVHDIRRAVHPPFVPFWTSPVAHQAHLDFMAEMLHDAFSVLGPILEVFYDTRPLHQALEHGGCPWLTVMGFPRVPFSRTPVLEPALLPTAELSRLRAGYRAAFSRFRRPQNNAFPVARQSSGAVSTADNATCSAAATSTTTTTTPAHDACIEVAGIASSTTTTSTLTALPFCIMPGAWQTCDVVAHVVGEQTATASTTQRGRGHLADILATATWCLQNHGALSASASFTACPRAFFGPDGSCHVFVSARCPGADRFLWVFAPEWHALPVVIPWSDPLDFADVLDAIGLRPSDVAIVSVDGVLRCEHPAVARPGSVVCVASFRASHFTIPLHLLSERIVGIQSLLFCAQGPGDEHLTSYCALRSFFGQLVDAAALAVGDTQPGKRFLIVRAGLAPLLCCAGTLVPPTLQQAQSFYDSFLLPHFGALTLKDTAQMPHEISFFVGRYNPREQRVWLLPFEDGADAYLGDLEGCCLADVPAPHGFRIEPSLRAAWCGLARIQPSCCPAEPPATELLVRTPPGLSSSSDDSPESVRNVRDITPEEARIIARWESRNRAIAAASRGVASSSSVPLGTADDDAVQTVPSSVSGSSSTSSCSSPSAEVDDAAMLQLPAASCAVRQLARRLPTPCRARMALPQIEGSPCKGPLQHADDGIVQETTPALSCAPECLSGARREVLQDKARMHVDTPDRRTLSLDALIPVQRPAEASVQLGICGDMILDFLNCRHPDGLSTQFDRIRQLPPAVSAALPAACVIPDWETCHQVHIYTDGSFRSADNCMAWALVAVGLDRFGAVCKVGFMSGTVGRPGQQGNFGNQTCSAHVAELAALLGAMLLSGSLRHRPVCIFFDAQSAGGIASGAMFPATADALAESVGHTYGLLCALQVPVTFQHVRAHTGIVWNDCADAVAKTACGPHGWHSVSDDALPGLLTGHELGWLWTLAGAPSTGLPGLAPDGSTRPILATLPEPTWKRMPGIPCSMEATPPPRHARFQVLISTYNTLSLRCPAQVEALDECMHRAGIHFVGLQETRVDDHDRGSSTHYHVFRSKAEKGQLGCQIWIHKALTVDDLGNVPKPSSAVILHSSPRVLAISVDVGGTCFAMVSAHALTSAADDSAIDAWWTDLQEILCRFPARAMPVIMIDANARFGRQSADPAMCKANNRNAFCMHAFLEHHGLCASHFVDVHQKDVVSWNSPLGKPDCIDYVLLPASTSAAMCSLGCPPDFGDMFGHDHRPVSVSHCFCRRSHPNTSCTPLDRAAMTTREGRAKLERIFDQAPNIPWEVDVDTHLDVLNKHVLQSLQQAFPAPLAKARNKSFSDQTWAAIRLRRDIRRKLGGHRKAERLRTLMDCFRAWAGDKAARVWQPAILTSKQAICLVLSLRRINRSIKQLVAFDQAMHCRELMTEAQTASLERRFAIYRGVLKMGRRYKALPVQHSVSSEGCVHNSKADIQLAFGKHFAKPEGGELLEVSDLHSQSQRTLPLPDVLPPEGIPTLQNLAMHFARAAPRKAAGPSGIPPEALRGAAFPAARCHMAVVLKSFVRSRPPLLWRGGGVRAIPKPQKPLRDVTGWRSILLMEIAGKSVGKCMRQDLAKALAGCGIEMHGGSRKGMPLEVPMHAVRAHGQRLKRAHVAGAVIFLDGANAFYSVLREHLYSTDALSCPAKIQSFVESVFSQTDDQLALLEVLAAPGILQETKVPPAVVNFFRHSLHSSWFAMDGDMACLFQTFTGTGPGAPLADILFQLVFTRFHAAVQSELEQMGLQCRSCRHRAKAPLPGWADDLALLLEVSHASDLVPAIKRAAACAHRAMAATGVTMNFQTGKSEVVPLLYGPGSAPVRRDLLTQRDPCIEVELCNGRSTRLHVVKEYVHLGGVFAHDASIAHDILRRRQEAELPFRRLRATLLRNPVLESKEKTHLLCSLIFAKYLHGAGIWHLQKGQEAQAFRAGMMGFMRRSMRPILGISSALASDLEVCTVLGLLTPDEALSRLHIMQLSFLAGHASSWLFEAIMDAADWLQHALQSLRHAVHVCGLDLSIPTPAQAADWLIGRHLQLRSLAKGYKRACLAVRAARARDTLSELRRRNHLAQCGGLIFSKQELASKAGIFFCSLCQVSCRSAAALASHKAKSHRELPNASFGFGTSCQVCMTECWDDNRMRDHLRRHPACASIYAHSDISAGGELSSRWVAAWRPVARLEGPRPWWATLTPEEALPQPARHDAAASIRMAFKPVPQGQVKIKVWAFRLFKLFDRFGLADDAHLAIPAGSGEAWSAFLAAQLLLQYRDGGESISNEGWALTVKGNRVELVPV